MTLLRRIPIFLAVLGLALGAGTTPAAGDGLTVTESGVGTAVVDRALQGRSETFEEGTQVVFFVRTEGGQVGETIDHVWFRDGKERDRVKLEIGGSPWRTWSRVTMHPGSSTGAWRVEARGDDDQVLASAEFTCVARP